MRQPISFWIILLIGLISLIILFNTIPRCSADINEIQNFLEMDSTDTNRTYLLIVNISSNPRLIT